MLKDHRHRAILNTVCFVALCLLLSRSEAAPFSNAGTGTVIYTHAPYAAQLRCKDLLATGHFAYTIISATEIAANGRVPAHCRVDGLIQSEVRFEVNLPNNWNGRIYMYGNGGHQTPASKYPATAHSLITLQPLIPTPDMTVV